MKAFAVHPRKVETVFERGERIEQQIMQRAYDLFLNRGAVDGADLEDWFTAEKELIWKPAVELSEKETEYVERLSYPPRTGLPPDRIGTRGRVWPVKGKLSPGAIERLA